MSGKKKKTTPWPENSSIFSPEKTDEIFHGLQPEFNTILEHENIPVSDAILNNIKEIYTPLAAWIASNNQSQAEIIGINGAQGSGKTTLTKLLTLILQQAFQKTVVSLSIDDFYKTRAERLLLAQTHHPLLQTRGVPGTHNVDFLMSVIKQLVTLDKNRTVMIPVFDKSIDDRASENNWRSVNCQPDIILLEGWCVGARAENDYKSDNSLIHPVNILEEQEDSDFRWRNSINEKLTGPYSELFSQAAKLIMLKIPHFDKVLEWRSLQEEKLSNVARTRNGREQKRMTTEELSRFVMHYERLTKWMLKEMPDRADVVLHIDYGHLVSHASFNSPSTQHAHMPLLN